MTEPTRQQAIDELEAAIAAYMRMISDGRAITTGWLLTVRGIDQSDGREMLAHEYPPAQPWLTNVGMSVASADFYRAGNRRPEHRYEGNR